MTRQLLYPAGLDPVTGRFLRPPATAGELAEWIRSEIEPRDPVEFEAELLGDSPGADRRRRGEPPSGVNTKDLAASGWGVIFPPDGGKYERDALHELLEYRETQAKRVHGYLYREFDYLPGESADKWLTRHKVGPGTTKSLRVPFYLLIVGDPAKIPFDFQLDLQEQHAVGRLYFETLDEYRRYACGVIVAEKKALALPRRATIFGVNNPNDKPTDYSFRYLVQPLIRQLARRAPDWRFEKVLEEEATKARLSHVLERAKKSAFLFISSHGLAPKLQHPDPPGLMGSIVCQDWPGMALKGPILPDHFFAAEDVPAQVDLTGLITFHFACFSLGTPDFDSFAHEKKDDTIKLAPKPLLSRLPQRLLGKEDGTALAVIGHVDRARGWSFYWRRVRSQTESFESTVLELFDGQPVGYAMRYLVHRYTGIAMRLNRELLKQHRGEGVDDEWLCELWTAMIDARSYGVFGDPATRLKVCGKDKVT